MKPQTLLQCSTIGLQAVYMLTASNKTATVHKAPTQIRCERHKEAHISNKEQRQNYKYSNASAENK
eukprot:6212156-Pleurochrysis_carterae.AAC.4